MRTWVKLQTGIVEDPKLAALPDHLFRVCINLFAIGGRVDQDGKLGSTEDVAFWLRISEDMAHEHLTELKKIAITTCKKGVWSLKNWDLYQSKPPSSSKEAVRERVQKSRENKQKPLESVTTGNEPVTSLHDESNEGREEKNREEEKTHAAKKPPQKLVPPTDKPDPVKELASVFEKASGVKLSDIREKSRGTIFWDPLRQMVKIADGNASALLIQTIAQMRHDNLTIGSPGSTLKVFISLHGRTLGEGGSQATTELRKLGYVDSQGNPV